jgi:hypothetical protein
VLRVGERLGARTLWHVSIANMDGLSGSGQRAAHFAHLHFTPWHHLQPVGAPRTRRGVLISPIAGSALAGASGGLRASGPKTILASTCWRTPCATSPGAKRHRLEAAGPVAQRWQGDRGRSQLQVDRRRWARQVAARRHPLR